MFRIRSAALALAVGLATLSGCATNRPLYGRRDTHPTVEQGIPLTDGPVITEGPATFAPPPGSTLVAPTAVPAPTVTVPAVPAPAAPTPPVAPPPREVNPQNNPTARPAKGNT